MLTIDIDKCKRDGICAAVCPLRLIAWQANGLPQPIANAKDLCMECGHCVSACPSKALNHQKIQASKCAPLQKKLIPSKKQVTHYLLARRSIRVFKNRPVERKILRELLSIANYSPSGHNTQPTSWVVLEEKINLSNYTHMVAEWMEEEIRKESTIVGPLHLERAVSLFKNGQDIILREAPVLIVAHAPEKSISVPTACIIALEYLELAAPAFGLGTCWAGYFTRAANSYPALKRKLCLPRGHACFGAMMLGYPKFRYLRLPPRRVPIITWG